MEVKFLGTGGAFNYEYGNSAAFINFRGKNILIDCGNSIYKKLRETKLADQIDYILLTHFHDDHVGSLITTVLHHKYLISPARPAKIIIPSPEFQDLLGWFISFGMPHPEKYVEFVPIEELEGITAIDTFGMHIQHMQSYAYIFEDEEEIVAYSGDLGNPNIVFEHLQKRNSQKKTRVFHEMCFNPSDGVHSHYKDLMSRQKDFDIFAYHLDPRREPKDNTIPLVVNTPELLL